VEGRNKWEKGEGDETHGGDMIAEKDQASRKGGIRRMIKKKTDKVSPLADR